MKKRRKIDSSTIPSDTEPRDGTTCQGERGAGSYSSGEEATDDCSSPNAPIVKKCCAEPDWVPSATVVVVAPAGAWWAEAATRSTPCTSSCGGFQNQKNPGSKIFSTSHCERGVGLTEARKYIQQPILQFSNKTTNKTFAKFISNNAN